MNSSLSRRQVVALGAVVVLAVGLMAAGLFAIGGRQRLFADTVELTVQLPDAHDIAPGTPVRLRGVDAGQVVAVEYPADDFDATITVRMKVDARFADRLYADASAQPYSPNLLGSKVIAIQPGTPAAGQLRDGRLHAKPAPDLTAAATKIGEAADETKSLVADIRGGKGSLGKLIQDDSLHTEITGLVKDTRTAVGSVEGKAAELDKFTKKGSATLDSIKQGSDAVKALPVIRGYVKDAAALLVRPDCRMDERGFGTWDIFEPDTAILTEAGKELLKPVVAWLRSQPGKAEVVIAAIYDPALPDPNAYAYELTKRQADVLHEHLRKQSGFKTTWVSSRKATAVGLGQGPTPLPPDSPLPNSNIRVVIFTPQ